MKKKILAILVILLINFNAYSDQNDPRLEILFNNLLQIKVETKARPTISKIWSIWSLALDKKVQAKFDIGNKLMEKRQYEESIDILLFNMEKLSILLRDNKIDLSVAVYPWPGTLKHDTQDNKQTEIWKNFCITNCKKFYKCFSLHYF